MAVSHPAPKMSKYVFAFQEESDDEGAITESTRIK